MLRAPGASLATALLLCATTATAQQDPPPIKISGFVSATAFVQDQSFGFGNGQNAEWAASGEFTADEWFLGGDVRNTRLTLGIAGPQILNGWRTSGVIEGDFFGGFVGAGPFSDEQPQIRLRLAYADLVKGGTTVRIGQSWTPLFGNVPVSTSHIGFPLGYGSAGLVGWRFPGIFLYQNLTGADHLQTRLTLAAFRGSWTGGSVLDNQSLGEAATVPQLEARLDVGGRTAGGLGWGTYLVGHVDRKDLSGIGADGAAGEDDELTGTAVELGARAAGGPLTVHGNVYWGKAIGQQFGELVQFGDISSWGAWGQVGYTFMPKWSVWGYYGTADADDDDVRATLTGDAAGRLRNQLLAAMLRYQDGPYALGLEWIRADTDWGTTLTDFERSANQIALSVLFSF